jgi:hypothetical protein
MNDVPGYKTDEPGQVPLLWGDMYCETGSATTLQSMRSAVAAPATAPSKPIPKRRSKWHDAVHSVQGNFMEVLKAGLHVGLPGHCGPVGELDYGFAGFFG